MSDAIESASARLARSGPGASTRAAAWIVAIAGLIVLASCRQERPLREVTLGLSWVHQAQFIGPYYADRHGLYAAEGLRVTFVPADASRDPLDEFLAGKYDFVIAQPDALIVARQKGHRVKAVAATYRIHPLVYLALESSGIRTPHDFRGKTVGVAYSERLPLLAMLRKLGINPNELQIVQRTYGIEGLQKGEYDVEAGWVTGELIEARKAGLEVNVIAPYDYGITFYADVLAVRETLIEQAPELVEKFVRATMRGWAEALQEPTESARLPLHYDPHLDPAHELANLRATAPLVHTGADRIGWMRAEDWESMIRTLHEEGMLPERPRGRGRPHHALPGAGPVAPGASQGRALLGSARQMPPPQRAGRRRRPSPERPQPTAASKFRRCTERISSAPRPRARSSASRGPTASPKVCRNSG